MPQSLCNFPATTKPQTTHLKSEDYSVSSTTAKENMQKSTSLATSDMNEMAELPPVEIGTQGTVASLITREIQHFRRIELNSQGKTQRNKSQMAAMGSSVGTSSRAITTVSTLESAKKKRGSSKFLPSMCSMVDVSDNCRPKASAFRYRNLKSGTQKFQL